VDAPTVFPSPETRCARPGCRYYVNLPQGNEDIIAGKQWRSGVALQCTSPAARAVVRADIDDQRLYVWLDGAEARDYLATLRRTLSIIHGDKITPREMVPLGEGQAVSYLSLLNHERSGREDYFHGETGELHSVAELLNKIETPEMQKKRRELDRKRAELGEGQPINFNPTIHVSPNITTSSHV
jgi:hypothetical protein